MFKRKINPAKLKRKAVKSSEPHPGHYKFQFMLLLLDVIMMKHPEYNRDSVRSELFKIVNVGKIVDRRAILTAFYSEI